MAGLPEILDVQSRENNKIWNTGENGVWGSTGKKLERQYYHF